MSESGLWEKLSFREKLRLRLGMIDSSEFDSELENLYDKIGAKEKFNCYALYRFDGIPWTGFAYEAETKIPEMLHEYVSSADMKKNEKTVVAALGEKKLSEILLHTQGYPELEETFPYMRSDFLYIDSETVHARILYDRIAKRERSAKDYFDSLFHEKGDRSIAGKYPERLAKRVEEIRDDREYGALCEFIAECLYRGERTVLAKELDTYMKSSGGKWTGVDMDKAFMDVTGRAVYGNAPREMMSEGLKKLRKYLLPETIKDVFDEAGSLLNREAWNGVVSMSSSEIKKDYAEALTDLHMQRIRGEYAYPDYRMFLNSVPEEESALKHLGTYERNDKLNKVREYVKDLTEELDEMTKIHINGRKTSDELKDLYRFYRPTSKNFDENIASLNEELILPAFQNEIRHAVKDFMLDYVKRGQSVTEKETTDYAMKWEENHPLTAERIPEAYFMLLDELAKEKEAINRCASDRGERTGTICFLEGMPYRGPSHFLHEEHERKDEDMLLNVLDRVADEVQKTCGAPGRGMSDDEATRYMTGVYDCLKKRFGNLESFSPKADDMLTSDGISLLSRIKRYRESDFLYAVGDSVSRSDSPGIDYHQLTFSIADRLVKDFGPGGMHEGKMPKAEMIEHAVPEIVQELERLSQKDRHFAGYPLNTGDTAAMLKGMLERKLGVKVRNDSREERTNEGQGRMLVRR